MGPRAVLLPSWVVGFGGTLASSWSLSTGSVFASATEFAVEAKAVALQGALAGNVILCLANTPHHLQHQRLIQSCHFESHPFWYSLGPLRLGRGYRLTRNYYENHCLRIICFFEGFCALKISGKRGALGLHIPNWQEIFFLIAQSRTPTPTPLAPPQGSWAKSPGSSIWKVIMRASHTSPKLSAGSEWLDATCWARQSAHYEGHTSDE